MSNVSELVKQVANCPILQTKELRFEPLRHHHLDYLWPHVSQPDIPKYMSWDSHKNKEETSQFIAASVENQAQGQSITWCIFSDREFLGIFSCIDILWQHRSLLYRKAEIAYWATAQARGKGMMTKTGKLLISYGFVIFGLNKITVSHVRQNTASKKLIERLGFRHISTQLEHFKKNGTWFDHLNYEMLHHECAYLNFYEENMDRQ